MTAKNYLRRRFALNGIILALVSAFLVLALITFLHRMTAKLGAAQFSLVIYCAAGIRKPVEAAARLYQKERGVVIRLNYGSSGELENKIALEKKTGLSRCDLYIPADPFFGNRAQSKGLTQESIPLARFRIVLALKPDSPLRIQSVRDLLDQAHPYALCNQQAGAGRRIKTALKQHGLWQPVLQNKKAAFLRVPEAANAVKTSKHIRAAFIWDATAKQFGLRIVECPELADGIAVIAAHITAHTQKAEAARRFARYLATSKKGKLLFQKFHFDTFPAKP